MTNRTIETTKAPPSFSNYSQGMETVAGARVVHVSGQAGITMDGELPESAEEQCRLAWQHVFAILAEANMDKTDIVEVWGIVSEHSHVTAYRVTRDEMLEGHVCCSTMLVCGLANPDWKVEIAVKAAKMD